VSKLFILRLFLGKQGFVSGNWPLLPGKTLFAFQTLVERGFPGYSITLLAYCSFAGDEKGFIF